MLHDIQPTRICVRKRTMRPKLSSHPKFTLEQAIDPQAVEELACPIL